MEIVKMEQEKPKEKILKILLKDFLREYTLTAITQNIGMTRSGTWKVLKKLENQGFIVLTAIGEGKTSAYKISLNWNNLLIKSTLITLLTKEALNYERWRDNFKKLEKHTLFTVLFGSILHSQKQANDIDILVVVEEGKNFKAVDSIIVEAQQVQIKKIHSIDLTKNELKTELKNGNKAYIEALKKGIVLFGQENFISFIKEISK